MSINTSLSSLSQELLIDIKVINPELILRKIHFKRKKAKFSINIADFLLAEFQKTNDVRFFNELLWIRTEISSHLIDRGMKHFLRLISDSGSIEFPFPARFLDNLNRVEDEVIINYESLREKTICLIGTPLHFLIPFQKLKKNGVQVRMVNIKYHPSKIGYFLLYNKIISKFYKLYFGSKNYEEKSIDSKQDLKLLNLNRKYDLGFHKLNFIINEYLISNFKLGLINDHWGALPLFKGKSTLMYSRLFGAKQVVTNHLIAKEIDAGPLLCFTKLDKRFTKKDIYFGLSGRILKSLSLLSEGKLKNELDNTSGIIFYEMHPWLKKYVKNNC